MTLAELVPAGEVVKAKRQEKKAKRQAAEEKQRAEQAQQAQQQAQVQQQPQQHVRQQPVDSQVVDLTGDSPGSVPANPPAAGRGLAKVRLIPGGVLLLYCPVRCAWQLQPRLSPMCFAVLVALLLKPPGDHCPPCRPLAQQLQPRQQQQRRLLPAAAGRVAAPIQPMPPWVPRRPAARRRQAPAGSVAAIS